MPTEGQRKTKFGREYYTWNPDKYQGPLTSVNDTVLKPIPPKKEDDA